MTAKAFAASIVSAVIAGVILWMIIPPAPPGKVNDDALSTHHRQPG